MIECLIENIFEKTIFFILKNKKNYMKKKNSFLKLCWGQCDNLLLNSDKENGIFMKPLYCLLVELFEWRLGLGWAEILIGPLYFPQVPLSYMRRLGLRFLGQRGGGIRARILELSSTSSQYSDPIIIITSLWASEYREVWLGLRQGWGKGWETGSEAKSKQNRENEDEDECQG